MGPLTSSITIARPREEVFDYLVDIANHAEFCDHYLKDWHLTREASRGVGAGVRFRVAARGNRFGWGDMAFAEVDEPYRILERGRTGKFNRVKMVGVYTLTPGAAGTTRVEYSFETLPVMLSDRLFEGLFGARWMKRQLARSLRRLRAILEEDRDRGARVTLAGV